MSRRGRKKSRPALWLALILLAAAVVFCGWAVKSALHRTADAQEWDLILVNSKHPLPADYQVELTDLTNGERVDERIYPDLQAMFDAARADGLELFVAAGYRTAEEQQALLDEKTEDLMAEGLTRRQAEKEARKWVARPGYSEHQLGLAVDINADTEIVSSDEVYDWLEENAYRYGFIDRYPADKTAVTGIADEPWHYRYVGYEAALAIHSQGLCLEEYLQQN